MTSRDDHREHARGPAAPEPSRGGRRLSVPQERPRLLALVLLVVLALVPVALWGAMSPLGPRFGSLATSLQSVAIALALAGTACFALNLFLGGRLWFVENLFGGLDRMYRVHQVNGRVAYLLLASHAVLMVASSATSSISTALHLFIPSGNWAIFLGPVALAAMTISIGLSLFANLEHEVFVWVQRSFGAIFVVALFHFLRVPAAGVASQSLKVYLAGISAVGVGAWIYRSVFGNVLVRRHDYFVADVRRLADRVTEITMVPVGAPVVFVPGQFLYVTFRSAGISRGLHPVALSPEEQSPTLRVRPGDIANQFHPFSITSPPAAAELKVAVKAVGDYTTAMRDLAPGDAARIEGPYGRFSYRKIANTRQIWIAGGIGVTPFLSMARDLETTLSYEIVLYYCTKSLEAALFLDDLNDVAVRYPSLRVISFREDEHGWITAAEIEQNDHIGDRDILICGPVAMIDSLTAQFEAIGIPQRRIHFERFGFIGSS
jgi:predicted ferric reductase